MGFVRRSASRKERRLARYKFILARMKFTSAGSPGVDPYTGWRWSSGTVTMDSTNTMDGSISS
jgi:hypothetical protein